MRGPMVRIKSDVRRLWRCPKCQYERRAPATQTTVRCHCEQDPPFMKLVEDQRQARAVPEELPPYYEYEDSETESVEELLEPTTQSENEIGEAPAPVESESATPEESSPAKAENTND